MPPKHVSITGAPIRGRLKSSRWRLVAVDEYYIKHQVSWPDDNQQHEKELPDGAHFRTHHPCSTDHLISLPPHHTAGRRQGEEGCALRSAQYPAPHWWPARSEKAAGLRGGAQSSGKGRAACPKVRNFMVPTV